MPANRFGSSDISILFCPLLKILQCSMECRMNTLGQRLKHRRNELGLNQKTVADFAGVTNAAVSKWESHGGESMSAIVAMRIARFLSVNPFWLVCGEGEPADRLEVPEFSEQTRELAVNIERMPPRLNQLMQRLLAELRR
jgi:transcriptional regulator with XRE-family HTH domain